MTQWTRIERALGKLLLQESERLTVQASHVETTAAEEALFRSYFLVVEEIWVGMDQTLQSGPPYLSEALWGRELVKRSSRTVAVTTP
jgi:hypothetical protein